MLLLIPQAPPMQLLLKNSDSNIFKAWAEGIPPCDPTVAEASAILWALQLALEEEHQNVMIEGDSKLCIAML